MILLHITSYTSASAIESVLLKRKKKKKKGG